jgi:hypothetical protein
VRNPVDPEKKRRYWRKWYDTHKERIAVSRRARQSAYWKNHPEELLWHNARGRARRAKIPFSISEADVVIPEFCPVLGLKLQRGEKKFGPSSPSLDKIVPILGYVPGNVGVISWRANEIKSNATIDELTAVLCWLKRKHQ